MRIAKSPRLIGISSALLSTYMRFVNATCRMSYEPAAPEEMIKRGAPFIIATWHGQNYMMPFARPKDFPVDILTSRFVDGEVVARTIGRFGCGIIRGSGSIDPAAVPAKGGVSAFIAMRRRLEAGVSIALTADFDARGERRASLGVIMLAKVTGRPIVPAAFTTSRRVQLRTWDKAIVPLPFGRSACVFGEFIQVPADASDELLELTRRQVEDSLNAATLRANEIVDRPK